MDVNWTSSPDRWATSSRRIGDCSWPRPGGRPIGYVSYVPSYGPRPGWLHDLTRRVPTAPPPGTMELINVTAIEQFRSERTGWLHFGFTPFVDLAPTVVRGGRHSRVLEWAIDTIAEHGAALYPGRTQVEYKTKWGGPRPPTRSTWPSAAADPSWTSLTRCASQESYESGIGRWVVKVAVVGATGNFGRVIVPRLLADPRVTGVVAIARRRYSSNDPRVHSISADVRDPGMCEYLQECEVVIHLAFVVSELRDKKLTREVNVLGTMNVIRAAAQSGGPGGWWWLRVSTPTVPRCPKTSSPRTSSR